jgi:LysM repeat protein
MEGNVRPSTIILALAAASVVGTAIYAGLWHKGALGSQCRSNSKLVTPGTAIHVVAQDQSLDDIARIYSVPVTVLAHANNLKSNADVRRCDLILVADPRNKPAELTSAFSKQASISEEVPTIEDITRGDVEPTVRAQPDPIEELLAPAERVLQVQRSLNDYGYGPVRVTGKYGNETKVAIQKYDPPHGVRGPNPHFGRTDR